MKILKASVLILLSLVFFISCKKEFSYETGNLNLPAGTWQFTNNAVQYTGNLDSAVIENVSGTKMLTLEGLSLAGSENFRIRLYSISSFTTSTYAASLSECDFDYFTSSKTIFKGDVLAGEFTVTITSLSNNKIIGTFSGQAEDSTGAQTPITLGAFSAAIDLTNNGPAASTSVGTLGANPDTCTPVVIAGNFKQGLALTGANTVQVEVNVTTPGTFTIATNSVNGVNFVKSGTFTNTGVQNVILVGSGTPQNMGVQNFMVTYGSSNCTFPLTFAAPDPPAVGTLGGAGGTCTPITAAGTYTQGVALGSSNTISIQVNITTIGSYSINTNTVNGVTFSATGSFSATGAQTVLLAGTGTPLTSGLQNFAVTFGLSTCNFSITFVAGNQAVFSCKIDGVFTSFDDQAVADSVDASSGDPTLSLSGVSPANSDVTFDISIKNNNSSPVGPGTYNEKNLFTMPNGYVITANYSTASELWLTYSTSIFGDMPPFTIVVTSVTATRVQGTFSGKLGDQIIGPSTVFKTITEGVFDLPFQ